MESKRRRRSELQSVHVGPLLQFDCLRQSLSASETRPRTVSAIKNAGYFPHLLHTHTPRRRGLAGLPFFFFFYRGGSTDVPKIELFIGPAPRVGTVPYL